MWSRAVRTSSVAVYLACTVLLVGGLGLTAWSALDLKWPSHLGAASETIMPPLFMQAATVPPSPITRWPSGEGMAGVAFYGEMIELLTPRTAVMARHDEAEPATEGRRRETVRDGRRRDNAREVSEEGKRKAKTANARKKREQSGQEREPARREPEIVREPPRPYAPGPFQLFGGSFFR
jgi:hypothetical protein